MNPQLNTQNPRQFNQHREIPAEVVFLGERTKSLTVKLKVSPDTLTTMTPATGSPAAAKQTSGKRLPPNTEIGSEPKAKRIRYTCDPPITVLAVRLDSDVTHLENKPFSLPPDLFLDFPICLENKISQNPGQDKFEFNVYRKDFHLYLKWIQREDPATIGAETGGAKLLTWLRKELGYHGWHGEAVLRMCRLCSMADEIDDQVFKTAILRALESSARGTQPLPVCCGLQPGGEYWKIASGLNLSPLAKGRFADWIVRWVARGLTREKIEESSATLDSGYLDALRKIVLPTTIKIWIGTGEDESTVVVNREIAVRRSKGLAKVLNSTSRIDAMPWVEEMAVDPSGDIRLKSKYERKALENWAETLTGEGDELKCLLSRYPEVSSILSRLRNDVAEPLAEVLTEMYVLALSLGDLRIQRLIVTTIINRLIRKTTWISSKVKASVVQNLPQESGLRRLIIDVMSAHFDKRGVKICAKIETTPPALLVQLLAKAYETRPNGGKFQTPQLSDLDKYCEPA